MPLGQVPVLEVDGSTKLAQTMTILRYIANRHGELLYILISYCLQLLLLLLLFAVE